MKKHILIYLLGIFTTFCIGAGVSNSELLTVRPATPKVTVIFEEETSGEIITKIKQYIKEGYIVKTLSSGGGDYHKDYIAIMEKY